jgi:glycosyltransferase involved in cell wall biosynthesis
MSPIKVIFCGSGFQLSNGYSRVAYALACHLANKKDIDLIYWGFQNFNPNPEHVKQRPLPKNISYYDAWANENPKQQGFGFEQFEEFVDQNKPDVIIIYNDFVVVSNFLEKMKACKHKDYKTIIYIDQVYDTQKKEYIKRLNDSTDHIICFTDYWMQCIKGQGLTKPCDFLQHGFDKMRNYPLPMRLARLHFGLKQDDFIVINANRNQNRKRLELTMFAWANFVSRHLGENVKLLIATHPTNGSWNLLEIYEHELRMRGIKMEDGMKHIILIDNPQQLTDEDMNILYNTADVGLNTTMGAGFELTNFEHGGIGRPQIAPYIGGIRDFLDSSCAKVIEPCISIVSENNTDGCPGKAHLIHPDDVVDALEQYYADEELRKEHGKKCRERILKNYQWLEIGEKFYNIIKKVANVPETPETSSDKISLDDIASLEKNLNINNMVQNAPIPIITPVSSPVSTPVSTPVPSSPIPITPTNTPISSPDPSTPASPPVEAPKVKTSPEGRKNDIRDRLKKKLEEKKNKVELNELLKLKKQLDTLKFQQAV